MIAHPQVVGAAGFEPATSWSQTRRDDRTTLRPELSDLLFCYQFDRYQTRLTIINLRGGSEIRTRGTVTRTTV